MYGNVAQWLKFCAMNHDIMGSNPAETVIHFFHVFFKTVLSSGYILILLSIEYILESL